MPNIPRRIDESGNRPLGRAWPIAAALGLALVLLVAAGCAEEPTPTPTVPTASPTREEVALATPTPSPAAPTPTASPTVAITPTATPCPVPEGWLPWVVDPGETLSTIAGRYPGMTAEDLKAANCLPSADEIIVGQRIYVPYYVTPTPTPCAPNPNWVPYTVQTGDTWYKLAALTGYSMAELQAGSCAEGEMLYAGQTVYLPFALPQPVELPAEPLPTPGGGGGAGATTAPPVAIRTGRVPAPGITPTPGGVCGKPAWQIYNEPESSAQPEGIDLKMTVTQPGFWAVSWAGCGFDEVIVSVDARAVENAANVAYGVACAARAGPPPSYVALLVNQQHGYAVVRRTGNDTEYLVGWTGPPGTATPTPEALYVLSALCQGNILQFMANDTMGEEENATGSQGDVGLVVVVLWGNEPGSVVFAGGETELP